MPRRRRSAPPLPTKASSPVNSEASNLTSIPEDDHCVGKKTEHLLGKCFYYRPGIRAIMANNANNDIPDSLEAINLKMNATTDECAIFVKFSSLLGSSCLVLLCYTLSVIDKKRFTKKSDLKFDSIVFRTVSEKLRPP
ncbi:hypothetical protein NECAME_06434 [Necator americanus]|uniref:Uncharacterized protein n=1 Tax=Necator americanus TaxID=51031 RepID=W2TWB1_NECAM|nr:hypothetical protein NECAME_06434 [Necator americanus]ETN85346.1 hypothetical protein NECAME_06434 [Necator americanus]